MSYVSRKIVLLVSSYFEIHVLDAVFVKCLLLFLDRKCSISTVLDYQLCSLVVFMRNLHVVSSITQQKCCKISIQKDIIQISFVLILVPSQFPSFFHIFITFSINSKVLKKEKCKNCPLICNLGVIEFQTLGFSFASSQLYLALLNLESP